MFVCVLGVYDVHVWLSTMETQCKRCLGPSKIMYVVIAG